MPIFTSEQIADMFNIKHCVTVTFQSLSKNSVQLPLRGNVKAHCQLTTTWLNCSVLTLQQLIFCICFGCLFYSYIYICQYVREYLGNNSVAELSKVACANLEKDKNFMPLFSIRVGVILRFRQRGCCSHFCMDEPQTTSFRGDRVLSK